MSKKVKTSRIPPCDACGASEAKYDAPMNAVGRSLLGASWANLCAGCFDSYGLDTSVTSEFVR